MSELTDEIVKAIKNHEPTRYPREWEPITSKIDSTIRLKIPGGWLVRDNPEILDAGKHGCFIYGGGICVVDDPEHEWILEDE